jgi:hypothetical protein
MGVAHTGLTNKTKTTSQCTELVNRHYSEDVSSGSVLEPAELTMYATIAMIAGERPILEMPRSMDFFVVWATGDKAAKKLRAIRRKYLPDSAWTRSTRGTGAFKAAYYVKAKKSVANAIKGECSRTHFNRSNDELFDTQSEPNPWHLDVLITANIMRRCKQCPVCKQAFLTSTGAKIYCSHKCYELARKSRAEERLAQASDI